MKRIMIILGTRPEVIKLAPVILELKKHPQKFEVFICNTEQQKELSNQTLNFFGLTSDFNLDVMRPNQTLAGVQTRILDRLSKIYTENSIDATIVQGDTMSVFCGALISFYNKIPVYHVEAGLRSYDNFEPFPEEALRQMIARITTVHFAPTLTAKTALLKENIPDNKIIITGNTVIDALSCLSKQTIISAEEYLQQTNILLNDKLVLVTVHRRENHGERLNTILEAVKQLSVQFPDHQFVMPVHPNPNVKAKIYQLLENQKNIILTPPLDYPLLVCILRHAKLIMTDSGGIQEEAPSFSVPLLVLRYETERMEGVKEGFATLVGANKEKIISHAIDILAKPFSTTRLNNKVNPYGDGSACQKIVNYILNRNL